MRISEKLENELDKLEVISNDIGITEEYIVNLSKEYKKTLEKIKRLLKRKMVEIKSQNEEHLKKIEIVAYKYECRIPGYDTEFTQRITDYHPDEVSNLEYRNLKPLVSLKDVREKE